MVDNFLKVAFLSSDNLGESCKIERLRQLNQIRFFLQPMTPIDEVDYQNISFFPIESALLIINSSTGNLKKLTKNS